MEKGARGDRARPVPVRAGAARIAVVLNVGVRTSASSARSEAIAQAKGELVEALPADGLAVLNADDPRVARWRPHRGPGWSATARRPTPTCAPRTSRSTSGGARRTPWSPRRAARRCGSGLTGRHQVGNTLAAAAVALELGMPLAELADGPGRAEAGLTRRMDVFDRPDGVTVIDDSYNANPASMAAALRALAASAGAAYRRGARLHGRAGPVRAGRPRGGRPARGRAGRRPAARGGGAGRADPRRRDSGSELGRRVGAAHRSGGGRRGAAGRTTTGRCRPGQGLPVPDLGGGRRAARRRRCGEATR